MTAAVVVLSIAVVLLGVLVAGLLRSHAEILKALHDLGAGVELDRAGRASGERPGPQPVTIDGVTAPPAGPRPEAPAAVVGSTLDGESVAIPLTGAPRDTLVAFLSSGCGTCQVFWDTFAAGVRDVPGDARLVVVTQDDEESPSALRKLVTPSIEHVLSDETWTAFDVPGSPYFVYVDAGGRVIGEGSAATWDAVANLLRQAQADDAERAARAARSGSTAERRSRDEQALAAAGIQPGDPSLWNQPTQPDGGQR